jgi:hypothetical protein
VASLPNTAINDKKHLKQENMANCVLCSTELKFMNTPTFGSGKLSDGGTVCTACFKKINNVNPSVAFKLKKHSLAEINSFTGKGNSKL